MLYDVIIIGKGPAGISASLYTARANLKTLIIGKNESVLRKAGKIENYYGLSEVVNGEVLLGTGEKQAERVGAVLLEDEVVSLEKDELFTVETIHGSFTAKVVILATGQPNKEIKIEGLEELVGNGVSYCTTCDGYFYRNLKVGVLGFKDYAVHEARELEAFTKDITLYTNGLELEVTEDHAEYLGKYKVNKKPIAKVGGTEYLETIYFQDGTSEKVDGLFVAYESASSVDFARKLGGLTEGNSIVTDRFQQTNLEGLYAAGDCTGGFKQIATAVGQGAMAGRKAIEYVRELKREVV